MIIYSLEHLTQYSVPYTASEECVGVFSINCSSNIYAGEILEFYIYLKDDSTGQILATSAGYNKSGASIHKAFVLIAGHRYSYGYVKTREENSSDGSGVGSISMSGSVMIADLPS